MNYRGHDFQLHKNEEWYVVRLRDSSMVVVMVVIVPVIMIVVV